MADFEARFAAAYRAYLDRAPTEVDAAAVARAVARSRRRWMPELLWPWAVRPLPVVIWLTVLALLLVLVGMLVFATGSRLPEPVAFRCPAGTNPNAPGPANQARPPLAFIGPTMAFDSRAGRMVAVVRPIDADPGLLLQTWTFDVCANTWTRMYPAAEPVSDEIVLVYDADSDLTIAFGSNGLTWAYDLATNTWTQARWTREVHVLEAAFYDAASGLVIGRSGSGTGWWTYDVETEGWTQIAVPAEPKGVAAVELIAYDSAIDRIVAYDFNLVGPDGNGTGINGTRLFDVLGASWSKSTASTPRLWFGSIRSGGEMVFAESLRKTVVISGGRVIAYDAATDSWEIVADQSGPWPGTCDGPTCLLAPWVAYDSANERVVVVGGSYRIMTGEAATWYRSDQVLAFDLRTRSWMTLLRAAAVQSE